MPHTHNHSHNHRQASSSRLWWTLILTAAFMVIEILGGVMSHSLALISDAGHMLTDVLAVGLALLAIRFATTPATERKTFGFYRLEILAALTNGVTLILLSGYIFYEAYHRFQNPVPIKTSLMIVVALLGLIDNLACVLILRSFSRADLNIRGTFLHQVGDLLSSVAVVIGGVIIRFTGWRPLDPLLSVVIGLVILKGAYDLVRESVDILLEAAPAGIDNGVIERHLLGIAGVRAVHHLHVWSLSSGIHALSAHVQIEDQLTSASDELLDRINDSLRGTFGIAHSTIQLECEQCEGCVCRLETGHTARQADPDGHDY